MTITPCAPQWRADIDALAFAPLGHSGLCMVHRHAFRTLLKQMPSPADCIAFFRQEEAAFQAAAAAKIARSGVAADANLHLTSRDLRRAMTPRMTKLAVASAAQSD